MLFGCFAIYFFLPSCKSSSFSGKTGQKLVGPINITGFDTSNGTLTLKDNDKNNADNVIVLRTQVINWNVTSDASKVEIVGIDSASKYQHNDPNFFSIAPHQVGNSSHWQATVSSPDPNNGVIFEVYYIKWKLKDSSAIYTFDPLLQLYP